MSVYEIGLHRKPNTRGYVYSTSTAPQNNALVEQSSGQGPAFVAKEPGVYDFVTVPKSVVHYGPGAVLNVNGTRISADEMNMLQDTGRGWYKSPTPLARASGATAIGQEPAGSYATVYNPSVVRTDKMTGTPRGRFYMYYSTDHSAAAGGVAMMFADSPYGPWTNYGQVYVDSATSGSAGTGETETPMVMWDPILSNFRMFYQQAGAKWGASDANSAVGTQSTLSATSTDGITWTKDPNFILDVPTTTSQHGDGHTGYFTPFVTANGVFAYSLYGGTNGADFVLWKCNGALNDWSSDRISLGYSIDLLQGATLRHTGWNCSAVVTSGGREWWVGRLSNFASGATAADCIIAQAPITKNYRHLTRAPVTIWTPTASWETSDMRCCQPFIDEGVAYFYYTIAKNYVGVISHAI